MNFDITTSAQFKRLNLTTLLEYRDYLIYERNLMNNTVNGYVFRTYKFFLFLGKDLNASCREDIKDFIKYLKIKEYENSTLSTYICTLKSYFSYILSKDEKNEAILSICYFLNNSIKIKKNRKMPQIPTCDEIKTLRDTMLQCKQNQLGNPNKYLYNIMLRDIAIFELLVSTGARSAEIRAIRVLDIDFHNQAIFIKMGKGGHQRVALFNSLALNSLNDHINNNSFKNSDLIFSMSQGNLLNYIIRRWTKRAKINGKLYAHSFRYFHITEAQRIGINIQSVADQVGHVNLNTTRYYTHLGLDHRRDQYKNYIA